MSEGLRPFDLVASWICRRVLPLQRRCHRLCDMSGRLDPTRISTFKIEQEEILRRINTITDLKLADPFSFGVRCTTSPDLLPWYALASDLLQILLCPFVL